MTGTRVRETGVDRTCEGDPVVSDERLLLVAIQRMLATPRARVVLWLDLARLPAGLVRPHHRRVAYAILETAAFHHDGELFSLANGDFVLLCRAPAHTGAEPAAHPAALPHTLSSLFQPNGPEITELTQTWWLEHHGAAVLAKVAQLTARS